MSALFHVRPYADTDESFVCSSWIRSYKCNGSPWTPAAVHHRLITATIERDTTLVAHAPGDPNLIYGYACGVRGQLHYMFVKLDMRGYGIARELVKQVCGEGPRLYVSHWTFAIRQWAERHPIMFNPWPFWSPNEIDRSNAERAQRKVEQARTGQHATP